MSTSKIVPIIKRASNEEKEKAHEHYEDAYFTQTLKLPLKPACAFTLALPYAKAAKPGPDECVNKLIQTAMQRQSEHQKMISVPTQVSKLAQSNAAHSAQLSVNGGTSSVLNFQAILADKSNKSAQMNHPGDDGDSSDSGKSDTIVQQEGPV